MRDYVKLAGILFIICAIAALALGFTNGITADKIAEQTIKANNEARQFVLPSANEFVKVENDKLNKIKENADYSIIKEVYEAKAGGSFAGYTVAVAPKGYGGSVELIVGIDESGAVQGVKVGTNNETPGLGKNAAKPAFSEQFKNKTWNSPISVIKSGTPKDNEIVALSGATITSKCVTEGVNRALSLSKELSGK